MKLNALRTWTVALFASVSACSALGTDWPMWRCDANRSAASPEDLPEGLRLQWARKLPAAQMAWPNEPPLHFDPCYEPIAMGRLLFVGSPNDGSVAAFDTKSGRESWRFYKASLFARGGCNYAIAGEHLLFVRDRTACYIDAETGARHYLRNIRSGCSNSFVAADGVLNCPCFSVRCVCNYPIQTSFAMVHMPEVAPWSGKTPVAFR